MKSRFINITLIISLTVLISLHLNATILFYTGNSSYNDNNNIEMTSKNNTISETIEADFAMEDETYINDIPFNTEIVSAEANYEKAISVEFGFEDEDFINDIEL